MKIIKVKVKLKMKVKFKEMMGNFTKKFPMTKKQIVWSNLQMTTMTKPKNKNKNLDLS